MLDSAPHQLRALPRYADSPHRSPTDYGARLADALHALVKGEIESGDLRRAVWKIAFRLANGDEQRAISAYVGLRVRALLAAHKARRR
jgi:hypothetical protein